MMVTVIKKVKETKECIIKQRLKFEDYKKCLENNQIILKLQIRLQKTLNVKHIMYLLKKLFFSNKISLSFNDDKRLRSFNGVKSYSYGTSVGRVGKEELL